MAQIIIAGWRQSADMAFDLSHEFIVTAYHELWAKVSAAPPERFHTVPKRERVRGF
jgi:hypothetical protein